MALELQSRDAILGLRHQVHRQEPRGQWQLAGLEDGATDQAALVATRAALEVKPVLAPELAVHAGITARTDKPLGPAPRAHERLALLRRAVLLEELRRRKTPLVLHLVLRHGPSPVQVDPSWHLGGSWRELHLGRLNHLADQEESCCWTSSMQSY